MRIVHHALKSLYSTVRLPVSLGFLRKPEPPACQSTSNTPQAGASWICDSQAVFTASKLSPRRDRITCPGQARGSQKPHLALTNSLGALIYLRERGGAKTHPLRLHQQENGGQHPPSTNQARYFSCSNICAPAKST